MGATTPTAGAGGPARARVVVLAAAIAAMALAALAAPAPTAASGHEVSMIGGQTTSWGTRQPGEQLVVAGRGFPAGSSGRIHFGDVSGVQLATYSAGSDGTFSRPVTIPTSAQPGAASALACHEVRDSCEPVADATMQIEPAPAPTTTTTRPLPTTTTRPPTTTTAPPSIQTSTTDVPTVTAPPDEDLTGVTTTTTDDPGDLAITTTTVQGSPPFTTSPQLAGVTTTTVPDIAVPGGGQIPNLAITHVEVTQGLQDLQNRFPLVAARRTYVRIHGTSEHDGPHGQTGVMAALEGVRDSVSLGIVFAENTPVRWDGDLHRISHDHVPYIRLPDSWTHGTVTLRAWVWAVDPTAANEPEASDNLREVNSTFHPIATGKIPRLWYWPLYATEDFEPGAPPRIHYPSDGYLTQHLHATRMLPVPFLLAKPQQTVIGSAAAPFDVSEATGSNGAPLVALNELHNTNKAAQRDVYSGMLDPELRPLAKFGGFASGNAQWVFMYGGYRWDYPWANTGGEIIGHEMSHTLGLLHAPCKYTAGEGEPGELKGGAVDQSFPGSYGWPYCSLAPPGNDGYVGFDVWWELTDMGQPAIMSNHRNWPPPWVAFPFMGYVGPGWMDPWHGCQVLAALGVPCDQDDLGVKDHDAPGGGGIPTPFGGGIPNFDCADFSTEIDLCQLVPDQPYDPIGAQPDDDWLVSGLVDPGSGTGSLDRALLLPGDRAAEVHLHGDRTAGGPYAIALIDGAGVARWIVSVDAKDRVFHEAEAEEHPPEHHEIAPTAFAVRVPALSGIERIVLLSPAGELAELRPSASRPEVAIEEVTIAVEKIVRIAMTDPDGDEVLGYLQWRPEGRERWQTIAVQIRPGEVRIPLSDLVGGEGQVRLLATDGFHTAVDVVDGVVVPNPPATVIIEDPLDGTERPFGRPLDLRGQAVLPGDEEVDDDELVWSSDRAGELGRGRFVTVDDLEEGRHEITLKRGVTEDDSGGSASIVVVITPSDLPDDDIRIAVAAVFAGEVPGAAGGTGTLIWLVLAGGVGALALAGGWVARGRRAPTP